MPDNEKYPKSQDSARHTRIEGEIIAVMKRDQQLVSYFLRAFNHQYGTSYKVVRWPVAENRQTPAVEAVACNDNGETIAIEHTLIQPFEGERIDTDRFMKVFGKLEGNTDLMKPGYNVDVIVRVGAVRKGTKWEVVADRVREHIVESIPALGEGTKEESIEGLPFALSVTLVIQSHGPAEKDHVWISRYESGAATLKQVVRTALERKLPKLVAAKLRRFRAIFRGMQPGFSAPQTVWRRGRDSITPFLASTATTTTCAV